MMLTTITVSNTTHPESLINHPDLMKIDENPSTTENSAELHAESSANEWKTMASSVRKHKMMATPVNVNLMPQMRIVSEEGRPRDRLRYIPLNPVDRQNRQLDVHPLFNEPTAALASIGESKRNANSSHRKYVEFLVYPQASADRAFSSEPG